jgi:hypothetical protein
MNKYLILGPNFPGINPKYRGIDRIDIPDLPSNLSKAELINNSIEKYMESRDLSVTDGEFLRDYKLASEIANVFTINNEKQEIYEVIQVIDEDVEQPKNMDFLGYDVISVNEHGSMIVDFFNEEIPEFEKYKRSLNDNFLFHDKSLAQEFSRLAGQKLGREFILKIVAIYK